VLSGPRRQSTRAELALVTLVDALRGRGPAAPARVVGWWPDSGHLVRLEPEPAVLTWGAEAVAAVLTDAPPARRAQPARSAPFGPTPPKAVAARQVPGRPASERPGSERAPGERSAA